MVAVVGRREQCFTCGKSPHVPKTRSHMQRLFFFCLNMQLLCIIAITVLMWVSPYVRSHCAFWHIPFSPPLPSINISLMHSPWCRVEIKITHALYAMHLLSVMALQTWLDIPSGGICLHSKLRHRWYGMHGFLSFAVIVDCLSNRVSTGLCILCTFLPSSLQFGFHA